MTLVDPFIPVQKKPLPGLVNNIPHTKPAEQPKPLPVRKPVQRTRPAPLNLRPQSQQVRHPRPKPAQQPQRPAVQPIKMQPKPPAQPKPQSQLKYQSKPKRRRIITLAAKLQLPLLFCALFLGGMLLQSLIFGQLAILTYAVLAFVRRISSSTTIALAGVVLLSILAMTIMNPTNPLVATFAVYAFLLLAVGIVTLIREIYGQDTGATHV